MPDLTKEQIEKCCRLLCAFRGVDPDGLDDSPFHDDPIANWEFYKEEIVSRHKALQADKAIIQTLS